MRFLIALSFLFSHSVDIALSSYKRTDLITNLPGLTYTLNFRQYAGYLKANPGNNLFYWLVESQSTPASDPLILWFNGGPGCSALEGLLTELGPYHVNPDGQTLYENVFSWNKKANVLFIEMPRGVGFSYQNYHINQNTSYSDDQTALDNALAIKDFLANYPEYQHRPFYIAGESYAGVYIPTLTRALIGQIQRNQLPLQLIGIAIGNGILSQYAQINSAIDVLYFHGIYGKDEWDSLKACCSVNAPLAYCDFSHRIYFDAQGNAHAKNKSDPCDNLVEQMGQNRLFGTPGLNAYNLYFACYQVPAKHKKPQLLQESERRSQTQSSFVDQGALLPWKSTDNQGGFPCYTGGANVKYLNSANVRQAIHVLNSTIRWRDCNHHIGGVYTQQYPDTSAVFDAIVQSNYPLNILIYNGDVDVVCNFLGDEWFVENLRKRHNLTMKAKRQPWYFQLAKAYKPVLGGYWKQFRSTNAKVTIDLLTLQGAGHVAPLDRPGPALQMITNFISRANYSTPTGYGIARKQLLPKYRPTATKCNNSASNHHSTLSVFLACLLWCYKS